MRTKTIRVRDLLDQHGTNGIQPFLYCAHCQAHYSANRSDYFLRSPDSILDCCGKPMARVVAHTTMVEV